MIDLLKDRRHLVLLSFIVGTRLLLIGYVYPDEARMFNGDSDLYHGLAVNLVEEGRYFFEPYEPRSDLIRTPGFPAFAAANYAVFGTNPVAPILWNIVFVVVVYLLVVQLLSACGSPSLLAPLVVFALDLSWLLYSKEILTEPLFTVVLLGSLLLVIRGIRRSNTAALAYAGGLMGIAALIKPIALYLSLFIVVYLALRRVPISRISGFAIIFLVLVAPWFIRNQIVHDSLTFTSIQSHNLLFAHGAFVYADAHDITHRAAQDSLFRQLEERTGAPHDEVAFARLEEAEERLAAEILSTHPVLYAKAIARGVLVTLFDPGRLVFQRTFGSADTRLIGLTNTVASEGLWRTLRRLFAEDRATVAVLLAYLTFLSVINALALLGIAPFLRASPALFALVTIVVVYLLVLGGPNGYARFRLYVFPFLLVYMSYGWAWVNQIISKRFRSRSLSRA